MQEIKKGISVLRKFQFAKPNSFPNNLQSPLYFYYLVNHIIADLSMDTVYL